MSNLNLYSGLVYTYNKTLDLLIRLKTKFLAVLKYIKYDFI